MKDTQKIWEEEYNEKKLMTGLKPAKAFTQWVKQIIKEQSLRGMDYPLRDLKVLDLGSGEGKNALYLAEMGAQVYGIEIARNAIETTLQRVAATQITADSVGNVQVEQGSIGKKFKFEDDFFDLIIDVTASNSLSKPERATYLLESFRVLQPNGQMFVRALCKDGDVNAKQLLQQYPGVEQDTYRIPDWNQLERVFTESDIRDLYSAYFTIKSLTKEIHYTTYAGRKYKRRFWVLHLLKS